MLVECILLPITFKRAMETVQEKKNESQSSNACARDSSQHSLQNMIFSPGTVQPSLPSHQGDRSQPPSRDGSPSGEYSADKDKAGSTNYRPLAFRNTPFSVARSSQPPSSGNSSPQASNSEDRYDYECICKVKVEAGRYEAHLDDEWAPAHDQLRQLPAKCLRCKRTFKSYNSYLEHSCNNAKVPDPRAPVIQARKGPVDISRNVPGPYQPPNADAYLPRSPSGQERPDSARKKAQRAGHLGLLLSVVLVLR